MKKIINKFKVFSIKVKLKSMKILQDITYLIKMEL